ncbi:hypothetical protein GM418_27955 [Maribellus comscasis]|uniref:HTH LytTR-type domain-containing protein n=1 Tax=Maribellus comscasis TaxID=2681766 RepID=A0A6I6K6R7_9BACT|nr:LytTR family transcriptional regulator DNA-binding domain-containing protein [Maribellus comscasis]QGY47363.1 hypothetical protein GM418_27955 [Maribellus comscasis]
MKLQTLLNKEFTLLDKKYDRYFLIVTILIFSILFLNIFEPFNINRWYSDSRIISFLRLSSYGVVVALVYLFTQFPLRKIFRQNTFQIKSFILWFVIEIVIISLVYIFLYGNPLGNFINDFIFSLKYTVLGICLPYSFSILIIYYQKHRTEIKTLQQKISRPSNSQLLGFKDERNKVKFSVRQSDVLYIESTDNYVSVYYSAENKVQRKLLRNTLKNLENMFEDSTIVRCHRSFMINREKIEMIQNEGKKLSVKLAHIEKIIPVSGKFIPHFSEYLPEK